MPVLHNFLTGVALEGEDIARIRTAGAPFATARRPYEIVLPDMTWRRVVFDTITPAVAKELSFLRDLGVAIPQREERTWLIGTEQRNTLYEEGGVFEKADAADPTDSAKIARLAELFRTAVLPAYIQAAASAAVEVPATVYEGRHLRDMIRVFDTQQRQLEAAPGFRAPL